MIESTERARMKTWSLAKAHPRESAQEASATFPVLFGEREFRGSLLRELRRSERSGRSFVLVEARAASDGLSDAAQLQAVARALAAATRASDSIGWLQSGRVLGVLLSEIAGGASASAFPTLLAPRIRGELARALGHEVSDRIELRSRIYGTMAGAITSEPDPDGFRPDEQQQPSKVYRALKRTLDILGSLALLTVLSPVFVAVALAVKLTSRGPALFRQTRVGRGMKPFTMLKFRSMKQDAADTSHRDYVSWFIKTSSKSPSDQKDAGLFKIVNDDRVTSVGRVLRRTSLDELPQLWNVLRGDMSLVGPRPPLQYEVEQYQPWHRRRLLDVKPGMTGLWQVAGRSRTTFDEMVRLDLRYARTCSPWNDVKILLATPAAVVTGKGAC